MRFHLRVSFLAVCIVVLECTASAVASEGIKNGSDGASEAAVTATTTTAAPTPPREIQQPIRTQEEDPNHVKDTHTEAEQDSGHSQAEHPQTSKEEQSKHQTDGDDKHEIQNKDQTERQDARDNVAASPAATQTTTTTENVNSVQLPERSLEQAKDTQEPDINSGQAAHAKNPEDQIHQVVEGAEVSHRDAAQKSGDQQIPEVRGGSADLSDAEGPSTTEVHSDTTTKSVENPSGPKEDNGKGQSNKHAKKETPDLEVKDAVTRAQPTIHTVSNTGGESAQSTPLSGGATGGKKEQKASLVPPQITDTTEKKDNQEAITPGTNSEEKEIIHAQKQKSTTTTTAEPTTSTVAPTTTLQKGFKIPQSLDKADGSKISSVMIAFATFVTFTVIAVAPLY